MMGRILIALLAGLLLLQTASAFGAGNIPSYAFLEGRAFRHGDIEDIIVKLAKSYGGGIFGRDTKFTPLDVKRIYFGNWARDYSQAVDVAALKKTSLQSILSIVMVLGFLAHGYVTEEFEVTKESLGAYLPTEHVDNPKGYADGEDARQYDDRLRGPINDEELNVDPRTGMKNYIANEHGSWDTSAALIRRVLTQCIEAGRRFKQTGDKADSYLSFQLLGRALHTLEDVFAHSNLIQLTLISMGHEQVFAHCGQNTKIQAPNGRQVYPLVTGTFGGADFIHSLLSEGSDKLSEASISDLSKQMDNARSAPEGQSLAIKNLAEIFGALGNDGQDLSREMDQMRAGPTSDPNQMTVQELHANLWRILSFRDKVMKRIENFMDRVPGLSSLTEKLGNSIAVFILSSIESYAKPLMGNANSVLGQSSAAVLQSHDQELVWHDANSSDPSHSFLSNDHFKGILNEPAGQCAMVMVDHVVRAVVDAWCNNSIDPRSVTDKACETFFHPDFVSPGRSQLQDAILGTIRKWFDALGGDRNEVLNRLTSDAVRNHRNVRIATTGAASTHNNGGIQSALSGAGVHVAGANILNAGTDLLSGKMPWQQGFGGGGQNAWRDLDTSGAGTQHGNQQYNSGGYQQQGNFGGDHQQGGYNAGGGYQGGGGYQQGGGGGEAQSYYNQNQSTGGYQQQQSNYGHQQNFGQPDYNQQQNYGGNQGGYNQGYNQGGYQGHGGPPPPQHGWGGSQQNDGPPGGKEKKSKFGDVSKIYEEAKKFKKDKHKSGGHGGGYGGHGGGAYGDYRESGHEEDSDSEKGSKKGSGSEKGSDSGSESGGSKKQKSGSESGSGSEHSEEEQAEEEYEEQEESYDGGGDEEY